MIFFLYGLSFFSMGLVMLFESSRSPLLAESNVLRPLALFGLIHGSHEWLEMFLDNSQWLVFQYPDFINWLRIAILALSFFLLLIFGWRVLKPQQNASTSGRLIGGGIIGIFAVFVIVIAGLVWSDHPDQLVHIDVMVRYCLGVPGALVAGVGLNSRAKQVRLQERQSLAFSLGLAGWGFLFYSFTQTVVSPLELFPANYLNTSTFLAWTGLPVQLIRAMIAVIVSIGMFRGTQIVEHERKQQFEASQKERVEALEQVKQELIERELLRQELLRHTVLAQEEGRSRIARELHDETAQLLTAFTLHLAALDNAAPDNLKVKEQVTQLKSLSRKMSLGIYRLVRDLRPAQLDDLGLTAALQFLVDEENKRGMDIHLDVEGDRLRLDPFVETVLFRVAQESLTNVVRHAGVNEAWVHLVFTSQLVKLRVSDQGIGFNPDMKSSPPLGWGLAGMRERVETVGGKFSLNSVPGQGTTIVVLVPLRVVEEEVGKKEEKDVQPEVIEG